ncbi:MAG: hypothetical protein M9905_20770, partial [Rhizobiaceae bacterium]|nr:hypothetical protein [Rhizobiaceae bacterium]
RNQTGAPAAGVMSSRAGKGSEPRRIREEPVFLQPNRAFATPVFTPLPRLLNRTFKPIIDYFQKLIRLST